MNKNKQIVGDVAVVGPVGALDASTAPQLRSWLSQLIADQTTKLVVDLSEVPYMASAGIRVLFDALQSTRSQSGDLRLAGIQPPVARVLDLTGLSQMFGIYSDVTAAVESFEA